MDAYKDYPRIIKAAGLNVFSKSTSTKAKQKSIDVLAKEVIQGLWGNGKERKDRLTKAGYSYDKVQARVSALIKTPQKTIDEIAKEVIRGDWGNGQERKDRLTKAGYNYDEVQKQVNKRLK